MQEALQKNNLLPGVVVGVGVMFLVIFRFAPLGITIFFLALVAAGVMKFFDVVNHSREEDEKKAEDFRKSEEAKFASLNKLRSETGKPSDELTPTLRAILNIGDTLVNYDPADNETVAEILKAYRVYVDKYLKGAATLAGKYRRAKSYIKSQDPSTIRAEVKALEHRINDGEKSLERTCKEKKATLERIEDMQRDQPEFRQSLNEIHATLQSLEASIKRAENDPEADEEIREEIQRTISSTSEAIEITLVKAKRAVPVAV